MMNQWIPDRIRGAGSKRSAQIQNPKLEGPHNGGSRKNHQYADLASGIESSKPRKRERERGCGGKNIHRERGWAKQIGEKGGRAKQTKACGRAREEEVNKGPLESKVR
jgi:hypothetical protein